MRQLPFLFSKIFICLSLLAVPALSERVGSVKIGIIFQHGKILNIYHDKFGTSHYHIVHKETFYYCFVENEADVGKAPVYCSDHWPD